jgi:hypothetical protein
MFTSRLTRTCSMVAAMSLCAGTALGQCNTWQTVMQMSSLNQGIVLDQALENGEEFVLYASAQLGVVMFALGSEGGTPFTGWTQDADGVATLVDGNLTCRIHCRDDAGIVVSVETPGMEAQWFGVAKSGETTKIGRNAFREVYGALFGAVAEDMTLTLDTLIEPGSQVATGINLAGEGFAIDALRVYEPQYGDEGAVSFWVGTMTTELASVRCAGLSVKTNNGDHFALPMMTYCNPQDGQKFHTYLSEPETGPACLYWDATAQSELDDLYRDNNACAADKALNYGVAIVGCGLGAVVCCGTAWLPTGISQVCCAGGLGCVAYAIQEDIQAGLRTCNEFNRVRACICAHAVDRHNGATTGSCTFNCP